MHCTINSDDICIACEKTDHTILNCSQFREINCNEHWEVVKKQNSCFGCLKTGHQVFQCKDQKRCGIESCKGKRASSRQKIDE